MNIVVNNVKKIRGVLLNETIVMSILLLQVFLFTNTKDQMKRENEIKGDSSQVVLTALFQVYLFNTPSLYHL